MAVDMKIKIDDVEGESAKEPSEKAIDVLSYSWGISNSGNTHHGMGSATGVANFQDISFVKWVDLSSCALMLAAASGKHYKKATLTINKSGGEDKVPYLIYTLEDVIISSISTGGSGGEDKLTENVSLNFGNVTVEYKLQAPDGSAKKGGRFTWKIAEGKK